MKSFLAAIAIALLPAASSALVIDDCSSFSLNTNGGTGSLATLGAGAADCAFSMTSSDGETNTPINTLFTTILPGTLGWFIDFDWNYSTQDADGPAFDPAGYVIDGVFTQLTDDFALSPFQNGSESLFVAGGSTFGWFINATDDDVGAANIVVLSNFAQVPVPAGAVLFLSGLAGLGLLRRRAAKS